MIIIVMMASSRRHKSELNFKNNTPCQLVYLCRRIGRVYRVHIQSQAVQFLDCLTPTMIFLGSDYECVCPWRWSCLSLQTKSSTAFEMPVNIYQSTRQHLS